MDLELYNLCKNENVDIRKAENLIKKFKTIDIFFLNCAILHNNFEIVKLLIEHGVDLNNKINDMYPIMHACFHKNYKITQLLLENGADVNIKNDKDNYPIMYACFANSFELVKLLIDNNASIYVKNCFDKTPLSIICKNNNLNILKLFFDTEFDLENNIYKKYKYLKLWKHLHDKIDIFNLLIQENIFVDICYIQFEFSLLIYICKSNNFKILKLIIDNIDKKYINYSDYLYISPLFVSCKNNNIEIIKYLLKNGATDSSKESVFSPLCYNNNFEIIKLLIEYNFNVNVIDNKNCTPLVYAAKNDNLEIIEYLLNNGAKMNVKNSESPLIFACMNNNYVIVEYLLKARVNVNATEFKIFNNGKNALFFACDNNNLKMVKLLINYKINMNCNFGYKVLHPLHIACVNNNYKLVKLLIQNNINLHNFELSFNDFIINELSPFTIFSNKSSTKIINILIKKKIGINEPCSYSFPIIIASNLNNLKIVNLLIKNGANINSKDTLNNNALHFACIQNNFKIAKLLIDNKIDVNQKNNFLETPLIIVCNNNNYKIAALLIKKNANINVRDKNNYSLIYNSLKNNNNSITKLLLKKNINIFDDNNLNYLPIFCSVHNNLSILKIIIEKCIIDFNFQDDKGNSALFYACIYNDLDIVEYLLNFKIDLTIKNNDNKTVLNIACENNNNKLIKLLLEKNNHIEISQKTFLNLEPNNKKLLIEYNIQLKLCNICNETTVYYEYCKNKNCDFFMCEICNENFKSKPGEIFNYKTIKCNGCFNYNTSLSFEKEVPRFLCFKCEKLKEYIQECNSEQKIMICSECTNNIKECPGCKILITKNGGCDHIICIICKTEFCFACGFIGIFCNFCN